MKINIGDKYKVTTKGIWGHDAYTGTYMVSGRMSHKGLTSTLRLTKIGDQSVKEDEFYDIIIKCSKENFYGDFLDGFNDFNYRIKKIFPVAVDLKKQISRLDQAGKDMITAIKKIKEK